MVGLYEGGADTYFTPWDLTWVPPIYHRASSADPFNSTTLLSGIAQRLAHSQILAGQCSLCFLFIRGG